MGLKGVIASRVIASIASVALLAVVAGCASVASLESSRLSRPASVASVASIANDAARDDATTRSAIPHYRVLWNTPQVRPVQFAAGTVRANQGTAGTAAWLFKLDQTASNNDVDVLTLPSVTIGTFPDNEPFNLGQVAGTATVTGGVAGSQGVGGLASSGAAKAGNPLQVGGVFNTIQPTVTTGQAVELQGTARGAAIVATGVDTFNVTVNTALPTGANTIGAISNAFVLDATLTGRFPAAYLDADAIANQTTTAMHGHLYGFNGTTWDRLQVDASKFLKVNCLAGCAGGSSTPSDAFANPTTAGLQMGFNMGWNGTAWDRLRADTTNGLWINCKTGCAGAAGDGTATGALNALNAAVSIALSTYNGADLNFTSGGNLVGTVLAEASNNGGTVWFSALFANPTSGAISTSLTNPASGDWIILYPGSLSHVRVRVSAFTSGSTTANLRTTATNPAVMLYGSDGTNLKPVRMATDGTIRVDPTGTTTQPVSGTITANAGTGTFSADVTDRAARLVGQVEGRAASAAAKAGNPVQVGGVFNTTQPTVTTGQAVELQATARGAPIVATGIDTFNVTVNAALPTGANVIGALSANQSVNVAQINGVAPLMGNGITGTGSPRVTIASDNTAFSVNATLSAETTKVIGTVRNLGNLGAAFDAATGAAPPANAVYTAGLGSGATGGFLIGLPVGDTYKAINISTATTTLLVTGVSGRQVRITAQHLVTAAANNVAWIEGTGATCGTGTAGMAGGTTAASGYNFAANGGLTQGAGHGTVLSTVTTGDSVCLVTSAATQLSGGIQYTIY